MTINTHIMFLPLITATTLIAIISQRKSLLITLLCLEAIVLSLVLFMAISCGASNQTEIFTGLLLLVFGACEGAIGLSILVSITRQHGSDNINILTASKC